MRRSTGESGASSFGPWQSAFSSEALRRAWLAVRANGGTAGADGATIARFERDLESELGQLSAELLALHYRPQRVTQVLVPKPRGDWRPITLWTVRDRVAQRAAHAYLEPAFERRFRPCSYGFRPGRQTRHAAEAVRRARAAGARWVFDADIKDCFGQMRNERVLDGLAAWGVPGPVRTLVGRWLNAGVWNAPQRGSVAGTSQGGVISPLLCNLYLHPFDCSFDGRLALRRDLWLVRYADDFVILARDEQGVRRAAERAAAELRALDLELHPQKTRLTTFDEGFQFVGWFFVRDEMYELK